MEIIIKNCSECPMCNNDYEYDYDCKHPDTDLYKSNMDGIDVFREVPQWCPLIKETIHISLDLTANKK